MGALLQKSSSMDPSEPPARIGETWETANESKIVNGQYAGRTLGDVARALGPTLIGWRSTATPEVPFPVLAKFIEAEQVLSVQVHPNDSYAQARLGQPYGKTEAWYVIATTPNAVIYHGLREAADREVISHALATGHIGDHLATVPAAPGDTIFTPAGTIHAIGAGIMLYEIQQYSDVTFRLYDWDRLDDSGKPREMHLEQGLDVLDTTPPTWHRTTPQALDDHHARTVLTACRYFALELLQPRQSLDVALDGTTFHLLAVLAGTATLTSAGTDPVSVNTGQSVLIPASAGKYRLTGMPDCRLLRSYVPDLLADIIKPLRERGVTDDQIAQLGGGWPDRNDILPLLNAGS